MTRTLPSLCITASATALGFETRPSRLQQTRRMRPRSPAFSSPCSFRLPEAASRRARVGSRRAGAALTADGIGDDADRAGRTPAIGSRRPVRVPAALLLYPSGPALRRLMPR
jgi:hypothetical protein